MQGVGGTEEEGEAQKAQCRPHVGWR
jgi:hypothetical protein